MIWTPASRKEPPVTVTVSSQGALLSDLRQRIEARLEIYLHVDFLFVETSLDFIAGTQIRAPRFVRALAGEWVWRLISDPRRLAARYRACIATLPDLLVRAVRARRLADQSAIGRSSAS